MIARSTGRVVRCGDDGIVATLPAARVGDPATVRTRSGADLAGEVTAVGDGLVRIAPWGPTDGVATGDRVAAADGARVPYGSALFGRALDAAGAPLDGGPALPRGGVEKTGPWIVSPAVRAPVAVPFVTRVAVLDALLTVGRGARIGIVGPPGTGKSSLIDAIAAEAAADAVVVALIGERGREAERWFARVDRRTTIVCATGDRSAAERLRAGEVAMRQAETLRRHGLHVLLVVDSLARFAAASRERRTAAREAVGRGGYPAGVWSDLARYVERAGNGASGSITMIATVLSEDGEAGDPLADAARAALDGHVVLAPALAHAGRFPAVDVLASASRTMAAVVDGAHARDAACVRRAIAHLSETAEARALGLIEAPGAELAAALAAEPAIALLLRPGAPASFGATRARLAAVAAHLGRRDDP